MASQGIGEASLNVLREWMVVGEADKVEAVGRLVYEADYSFIFDQNTFVAELLTCASNNGEKCYEYVCSKLFNVSISGTISSIPGKPPPRYIRECEQAKKYGEIYNDHYEVAKFYRDIEKYMNDKIKEGLMADEELLEP